MPVILTILVGKRLSENSSEDHWSVRDYAANLITHICTQYGSTYGTLQPRITKTLLRAFLDPTKPFATQYGAIRGLTSLGKEVVEVLLLPNIKSYGNSIEAILGKNVEENSKVSDAKMCQEAILVNSGRRLNSISLDYVVFPSSNETILIFFFLFDLLDPFIR